MPSATYDEMVAKRLVQITSAEQVHPGKAPEQAGLPMLEFFRVSTPRDNTQSSGDVRYPRFQITCWGRTYDEAMALGDQVAAGMGGWRDTVGLKSCAALVDEERGPVPDPETGEYQRIVEVVIW